MSSNLNEKPQKPVKLMIGLPISGHCFPAETVEALLNLKVVQNIFTKVIAGESIAKARNFLARVALEQGVTHLLFLDDDNPIPQDTLEKFLRADKDIICAPVLTRHEPFEPCIFKKVPIEGFELPGYVHINKVDISGGNIVQVDACGMACTLIKREVLEKLFPIYEGEPFAFSHDPISPPVKGKNKREMSEDVAFCERATNEGFTIWCDTTVRPIHFSGHKFVKFNDNMIL